MTYSRRITLKNICKECLVEPICTELCYESLAIIDTGMEIVSETSVEWGGIEEMEKDLRLSREELSEYYWWYFPNEDVDIKFVDLKELKKKEVSLAQIVHGRVFVDEVEAFVIGDKLAVPVSALG